MKIFNKNKGPVPVDENGNPIEGEKKKVDLGKIGLSILKGVGCAAAGIVVFVLVGLAMDAEDNNSGKTASESTPMDDPYAGGTDNETTESSGETAEG